MTIQHRGHGRILIWSLTSCMLLALAACSSSSVNGRPAATAARTSTTSATATPATTRADWITLPPLPAGAMDVTFAPSNPRLGLLCTSVNTGTTTGQPRLYKTTDGGQSWHEMTGLPPMPSAPGSTTSVPPLLYCTTFVDATDTNDIFLQQIVFNPVGAGFAIARALYRSRDGGATWGSPLATLDQTNGFGQLAVVGSRLVATALPSVYGARACSDTDPLPPAQPSTVVYASDDGGQTWQPLGQSIESQHLGVVGMALMGTTIFARANTLFPGGCATSGNFFQPKTSLWRSSDGGRSWQQVASFSAVLNMLSFTPRADGTGYYGVGLLATPSTGAASASFTVLFSADGGTTWSPLPALDPTRTTITDPADVQWDPVAVTPSGTVIGQVTQYPIPGGPSGIVAIRPSDPRPAWTLYASTASTAAGTLSGVTAIASGSTLWALDVTTHTLSYLPLP